MSDWVQKVREVVVHTSADGTLNIPVLGGSDEGEFAVLGHLNQDRISYVSGGSGHRLDDGDIILDVQGQKVAGYTQRDVVAWMNHCCRNGNPVILRTLPQGSLPKDLRQYLNARFLKGSPDHDLQNTIRDNLYLRTVPCTTRSRREGEKDGVDYTFLTLEEFMVLERSGSLLESGVYEGNHYGTPKPLKDNPVSAARFHSGNTYGPHLGPLLGGSGAAGGGGGVGVVLPGAHPSSEGKRRRNRSNVEAMAAKSVEPQTQDFSGTPPELGPLPSNWEKAYTEQGEPYFIDHNSGTSHWLDPRLAKVQKKAIEECEDDELPYGWEQIDDPQFGTYYIDHINRRTQYENPVLQAKQPSDEQQLSQPETVPARDNHQSNGETQQQMSSSSHPFFTRNPSELQGDCIRTILAKSPRGFGFTIVGGDEDAQEFLQIKSVVENGPAWKDGQLLQGDVLVYVNDVCVLGYTHQDVVTMFQNIPVGERVHLEACRGYPLPFDPDDPNTEIVTTLAVSNENSQNMQQQQVGNHQQSNKSLPHLAVKRPQDVSNAGQRHNPSPGKDTTPDIIDFYAGNKGFDMPDSGETYSALNGMLLTVHITKGALGFGFTIADSAYGQKVKKILDRPRCGRLQEGDILLEINGRSVRGLEHGVVVQVLKDCPKNQEAVITVQRGGASSPTKARPRSIKIKSPDDSSIPRNNTINSSTSASRISLGSEVTMANTVQGMYRSKTPTAELYSTREKEVIPNRPKTPLVDTRNWTTRPKTPNGSSIDAKETAMNAIYGDSKPREEEILGSGWHRNFQDDSDVRLRSMRTPYVSNENTYGQTGHLRSSRPNTFYGTTHLQRIQPTYTEAERQDVGSGSQRKQSTSFEHEQPSPGLVSRIQSPRDRTGAPTLFRDCVETTVTLMRHENGFGFRIVGGKEEGSQVSIGHIVPGGAADLDGRLSTGDEIVMVDGQSVLHTSHHHVVQLMGNAGHHGRVTLGIRRRIQPSESLHQAPYDVTVTRRENEGFGFVIISSVTRAGSTIGRLIEHSPAERCGQLHVGDRILAVNNTDIINMHHGDIVNLIKESGYSVTLTIGPPLDDASSTTSTSLHGEEDEQYYAVELLRGTRGFGFSIRGGKEFQNMPLFVLRIAEMGPAAQDGRLRVGDQIIEINGINTKSMTHADAIEIIKQGGNSVRLLVKRNHKLPQALEQSALGLASVNNAQVPAQSQAGVFQHLNRSSNGPVSQSSPRFITTNSTLGESPYHWEGS